jgi:hypothetical protein
VSFGDMLKPPLTTDPDRRRIYPDDVYFREAVTRLRTLDREVSDRVVRHTTFLLFKPEALAGRRIERALRYARDHGFEPTGACRVPADRHTVRSLWRYQLNSVPLPVIRVMDMIVATAECVFVAFADLSQSAGDCLPAAVRLSDLKGSSTRLSANSGLLREALSCTTMCLNFVHAPDDPADMIRELGVLFEPARLDETLRMLSREPGAPGWPQEVARVVARAYGDLPRHHLDLRQSVEALRRAVVVWPRHKTAAQGVLDSLTHGGDDQDLPGLVDWLDRADCGLGRWDRITLAAYLVGDQLPARLPLIGPPPRAPAGAPAGTARGAQDPAAAPR